MGDAFLTIIIALVIFGVGLAVVRFVIRKWFPEATDYVNIIAMVLAAALFIYVLRIVWPLLAGGLRPF